jgi:hypothetical protein
VLKAWPPDDQGEDILPETAIERFQDVPRRGTRR